MWDEEGLGGISSSAFNPIHYEYVSKTYHMFVLQWVQCIGVLDQILAHAEIISLLIRYQILYKWLLLSMFCLKHYNK